MITCPVVDIFCVICYFASEFSGLIIIKFALIE